jgi:hypothetical protein
MKTGRNRLAADIGGTFTDVAAFEEGTGRLLLGKALSTPQRMVDGIAGAVAKAGSGFADAALFLHGSTVAINTLLERTCAAPDPVLRHWSSFSQAARENADSRIYIGFHFRRATDVGLAHGTRIGTVVATTALRPVG